MNFSLTEVYFLGFSWGIKEGTGHTQSVKRPARPAGPESQSFFLSSFSKTQKLLLGEMERAEKKWRSERREKASVKRKYT